MDVKGCWASLSLLPMWLHCLYVLCLLSTLNLARFVDLLKMDGQTWPRTSIVTPPHPSSIIKWWPLFGRLLPVSIRCTWVEKEGRDPQLQPNYFVPWASLLFPLQQPQHIPPPLGETEREFRSYFDSRNLTWKQSWWRRRPGKLKTLSL